MHNAMAVEADTAIYRLVVRQGLHQPVKPHHGIYQRIQ
jgi:hypothetical protein